MNIELLRADISSIKVDALIYPSQSRHVDGVGEVPSGNAVVTSAGNLLCKFVIHAIGPQVTDVDQKKILHDATRSALERAEELAIASVAFMASRNGMFGFPIDFCAPVMLGATLEFRPRARSLQRVIYCLFGTESYERFRHVLEEIES
ncbi:MAG TPA: macro domain-containing protein [Thermoanaerobaculia bacterium]|nr:macro domain-containing protein [Thermoanaerobaculia bacterium]